MNRHTLLSSRLGVIYLQNLKFLIILLKKNENIFATEKFLGNIVRGNFVVRQSNTNTVATEFECNYDIYIYIYIYIIYIHICKLCMYIIIIIIIKKGRQCKGETE